MKMYKCLEMQTNEQGTTAFLPIEERDTMDEIAAVFYVKAASAVLSPVPVHTIMTFTAEGNIIQSLTKCFRHGTPEESTEE